jgi:hypothetical protein
MNLDEELRGALTREAEGRTAPPPDVVGMISGGRARRRRRTVARLAATAAAVVLVGAAGYGVTHADPLGLRTGPGPAGTPSPHDDEPPGLEPGRPYRMVVGMHADGAFIEAEVTVDSASWVEGDFARLGDRTGSSWVGFGVYEPHMLAAGSGCVDDPRKVSAGNTPEALAAQLAGLPRSEVLRAPTRTEAFGDTALHLRMRIDSDCGMDYYRVADTARGERGITYTDPGTVPADVVIDFWVLDLDGTPVIVDQWRDVSAPAGIVDQARRARESVTFVPRD